jgi:glucokinase
MSAIDNDAMPAFPVLIGDIGGTNARFAIVEEGNPEPQHVRSVKTADFASIDEAIIFSVFNDVPVRPRSAFIAVAAPVDGDEIPLTNCDWVIRPRQMIRSLDLEEVVLLNDFEAQALAVVALDAEHLEQIGGDAPEAGAGRAVLGPGTGLGVAGLVHSRGTWIPVPGEGGHVDIGPRSSRDHEVFPHIERIEGRISAEQILCGRGLVNLYRAVASADGRSTDFSNPADITAAALADTDPVAKEALDIFVTCLGRLAGDLALIFMSKGGVFLTGGIAQKIVPALKSGLFRAAFEDKAPHTAMIRQMPVYVITHPLAALIGLAAFACQPDRFGVETGGRRWRKS